MFLFYSLLVDLTVFSNWVSAYVLVCGQMVSYIGLFIGAVGFLILTFASGLSILMHSLKEFDGIPPGGLELIKVLLTMVDGAAFKEFHASPAVAVVLFGFVIATTTFLTSLLVAQLTTAYSAIFELMVGYARLGRMRIIVETMPKVTKKQWDRFVESLRLSDKIEFNAGDVGVSCGVQVVEPANLNPTTEDQIRRYGGSTELSLQFPEDDLDDSSDSFAKLEKLVVKSMAALSSRNGSGKGGGSSKGGGTGTGISGSGGGGTGGSGSGGNEDDAASGGSGAGD